MEARKITIVSTSAQKKYVINSAAETLEELKADLRKANINYMDMTFMEGLTRTEMVDDKSMLPTNVQRVDRQTGETVTTNELVFMLTNTSKKIKSGIISRQEAYFLIKDNDLKEAIMNLFGKNFTQCKTSDLVNFIETHLERHTEAAETAEPERVQESEPEVVPDRVETPKVKCHGQCKDLQARKAISELVEALWNNDYINSDERDEILDNFSANKASEYENAYGIDSPYSDEELDEMFNIG